MILLWIKYTSFFAPEKYIFFILLDGPSTAGSQSPKGEPAIIAKTNKQSSEEAPTPEAAPDAPGIQMIDCIEKYKTE